jgi:ankyrin repeat protein
MSVLFRTSLTSKSESANNLISQGSHSLVQDNNNKWSAMHCASKNGLESAVAKLLSLGADAALKDKVRACAACMCAYL